MCSLTIECVLLPGEAGTHLPKDREGLQRLRQNLSSTHSLQQEGLQQQGLQQSGQTVSSSQQGQNFFSSQQGQNFFSSQQGQNASSSQQGPNVLSSLSLPQEPASLSLPQVPAGDSDSRPCFFVNGVYQWVYERERDVWRRGRRSG